jgi:hypothetical protein
MFEKLKAEQAAAMKKLEQRLAQQSAALKLEVATLRAASPSKAEPGHRGKRKAEGKAEPQADDEGEGETKDKVEGQPDAKKPKSVGTSRLPACACLMYCADFVLRCVYVSFAGEETDRRANTQHPFAAGEECATVHW